MIFIICDDSAECIYAFSKKNRNKKTKQISMSV